LKINKIIKEKLSEKNYAKFSAKKNQKIKNPAKKYNKNKTVFIASKYHLWIINKLFIHLICLMTKNNSKRISSIILKGPK
jgi:hypothetical protein